MKFQIQEYQTETKGKDWALRPNARKVISVEAKGSLLEELVTSEIEGKKG